LQLTGIAVQFLELLQQIELSGIVLYQR
jgi:hypothetical protein